METVTDCEADPVTSQVAELRLERPRQPRVSVLFKRLWKPQGEILLCCCDAFVLRSQTAKKQKRFLS